MTTPASVTVAAGTTSAKFTVTAGTITTDQSATVTATLSGASKTATISLAAAITLSSLACTSTTLASSASSTCTVTLSKAPSTATVVTLSDNSSLLTTPASVTVAAGSTSASFTVTAGTITTDQSATLTATLSGVSKTATISLAAAATLSSLTCTATLTSNVSGTCTVSLSKSAPTGGVTLAVSDNSALISVPTQVVVPAGATSASFAVIAATITSTQSATVTATYAGVSKLFTVTLSALQKQTLILQPGVNGYTGAVDRSIYGTSAQRFSSYFIACCAADTRSYYLLWFDLSSIPANSNIISASLSLDTLLVVTPAYVHVRQVMDPNHLGGAYLQGWSNATTGANSVYRDAGTVPVKWTSADPSDGKSHILNAAPTDLSPAQLVSVNNTFYTYDVTSGVNSWISKGAPNEGFLIFADDNASIIFNTISSAIPSSRPTLQIVFTAPATTSTRQVSTLMNAAGAPGPVVADILPEIAVPAAANDGALTVTIEGPAADATIPGAGIISGWALDRSGSASAITSVKVSIDDVLLGTAQYGISRTDLCAARQGISNCPNVGFAYSLNTAGLQPGPHVLTVTATNSAMVSGSATEKIVIGPAGASLPVVQIDSPTPGSVVSGNVAVSGWAMGVAGSHAPVKVFVDGAEVGDAGYGLRRPGVCASDSDLAGCPNVGYAYLLETSGLDAGPHSLTVTAGGADQTISSKSVNFTIDRSQTIFVTSPTPGTLVNGVATVSGWTTRQSVFSGPANNAVSIKVDGIFVGNAISGISRPDVCRLRHSKSSEIAPAAAPQVDCSAVGFVYLLDTRSLTPGLHLLTVSTAAPDGTPDGNSWTIDFNVPDPNQ